MKKLILITMMLWMSSFAFAEEEVHIIIDGEHIEFTEEYGLPFIDENYRTQVPLRTALENFGAEVNWVHETFTATVTYKETFIEVPIGEKFIIVNGLRIENDTVAVIKEGRTYLPLRVVYENLGAKVVWDGINNSVLVEKNPIIETEPVVYGTAIGETLRSFSKKDQNGNMVKLESFIGEKVLLTFYTTW